MKQLWFRCWDDSANTIEAACHQLKQFMENEYHEGYNVRKFQATSVIWDKKIILFCLFLHGDTLVFPTDVEDDVVELKLVNNWYILNNGE